MLDLDTYLVKQHAGVFKMTAAYDIFDPNTNEQIGMAREEPTFSQRLLWLFVHKQRPTTVNVYGKDGGAPLFSIHRGLTLFRSKVYVRDGQNNVLGYFKTKVLSVGGGFWVYDHEGNHFAEVKGDWKGWNFKFLSKDGQELGTVTKKWAGVAKELFTSADNYVIALTGEVGERQEANTLLLAAGLAVDIVYKQGD